MLTAAGNAAESIFCAANFTAVVVVFYCLPVHPIYFFVVCMKHIFFHALLFCLACVRVCVYGCQTIRIWTITTMGSRGVTVSIFVVFAVDRQVKVNEACCLPTRRANNRCLSYSDSNIVAMFVAASASKCSSQKATITTTCMCKLKTHDIFTGIFRL